MEKILAAMNPLDPNKKIMDFALYLARLTKSRITGIFLEKTLAGKLVQRDLHGFPIAFADSEAARNKMADSARVEEAISNFKKVCSDSGVLFEIHRDHGMPIEDVIAESRFSDMLIVDAAMTFNQNSEETPIRFVEDIIKESQCPVIVAPEEFDKLDEIVFCYNGAFDSIFAIKQFTHLFPQLENKRLIILEVIENKKSRNQEDTLFTDWLRNHYSNFKYEIINGQVNLMLFDFLFKRKNIIIVMGAYGRDALSTFFKKSTAEPLIKIITQPIFISHL